MVKPDESFDKAEDEELQIKPFNKKKVLIYVVPVIVVIGLAVSFITVFTRKDHLGGEGDFSIVTTAGEGEDAGKITVFYTLPELFVRLRSSAETSSNVKVKISIELSSVDDIKTIEAMIPRINDTLLAHIVELTPDEISGSDGLYNLKEELLYRINLLTAPVKVSNLNFKTFDIQKNN